MPEIPLVKYYCPDSIPHKSILVQTSNYVENCYHVMKSHPISQFSIGEACALTNENWYLKPSGAETGIFRDNTVITMAANALAFCVSKSSAVMVLAISMA